MKSCQHGRKQMLVIGGNDRARDLLLTARLQASQQVLQQVRQ
jgi:hypothetical protein